MTVHPVTGAAAPPARLAGGDAPAGACAWLDDDRVVTGDDGGRVRVWRLATRQVERAHDHGAAIVGLTAGPGGAWLAVYGAGTDVTIWDPAAGAPRARLGGHRIGVWRAELLGPWLVTVDETNQVFAWDPETGERLRELPGDAAGKDIVIRGDRLAVFGRGRSFVWRLAPEATLRRLHGHTAHVRDLAFAPDGATLWSASADGSARGVDVTGARPVIVLGEASYRAPPMAEIGPPPPPSPRGLRSVQLAPGGATVATAAEDDAIALGDAATGAARAQLAGHTSRARRVVFSPDGAIAYSVGDTTLRRWDAATGRELGRAELRARGWDVARVGDDTLATVDDDQHLALWDAATLAPRPSELDADHLRELVVVGDRLIAATHARLGVLAGGRIERAVAHERVFCADATTAGAAVAGALGLIAAGDSIGQLAVYEGATLALRALWRVSDAVVTMVRFRPDGAVLATASGRRVQLWTPEGLLLAQTPELHALVTQLAWSPDGTRLALAGATGTVWVWQLAPDDGAGLDAFVRCVSSWALAAPGAAARGFDPADCAGLGR